MKPLNLLAALMLYALLRPHIPKKYDDFIDLVSKMIDNMITTDRGEDYVTAIAIMNNSDMETVALAYEGNGQGLYTVFLEGLKVNQFPALIKYAEMVLGYGR